MLVDLPTDTQYELQPRDGALSEIRGGIKEIWHTSWFKGVLRPLNIVPKAIKTTFKVTDMVSRDAIQALGGGEKADGYVLRPIQQTRSEVSHALAA
jgi:hypothetical protein